MTVEIFIALLVSLSTVTALVTSFVKKMLDDMNKVYASNIIVLIVSAIVGGGGTCVFYVFNDYPWNAINIVCIFMMIIANAIGSMVGYDKVIQTIKQLGIK